MPFTRELLAAAVVVVLMQLQTGWASATHNQHLTRSHESGPGPVGPGWIPEDWPRVSVVVVDALWVLLGESPKPPSYASTSLHDACSSEGFTFVRVAGTAFWPNALEKYLTNRSNYLQAVDQLYNVSQAAGCKVLLSLFWNWFAGADMMHEPLGAAFRNTSSLTRQFWQSYSADVIHIAAKYPAAVAGWELGNELNLLADLNMSGSTNGCHPPLGTPSHRTSADNFSTTDMIVFENWLAESIRKEAVANSLPGIISTGHSIPRTDAWHLRQSYHAPERDWTADSEQEFVEIFRETCACCELCSAHFYAGHGDRWGSTDPNSTYPLVVAHRSLNNSVNQTLYVGEFGDIVSPTDPTRPFSAAVIATLQSAGIRLATLWVWGFFQWSSTSMALASINASTPADQHVIQRMRHLNRG